MKRYIKIRNRNLQSYSMLIATGMNFIVFLFNVFICYPVSETGDDSVMMSIVSGGYGEYSSYIVFSNIFYSKIIVLLTAYIGGINWYTAIQFLIIFLAFTCITYVLLRKFSYRLGSILAVAFLICFSYDMYVSYQFTKSAAIATATGCFLLFYFLEQDKIKIGWSSVGVIFILIGSLIRFYSFLAVMGIFSVLGVIRVVFYFIKKQYKCIWRYVIVFSLTILSSFGFYLADKAVYNSQPDWKEYKEYNSMRSKIRDYPIPIYEENTEAYKNIGMSKNDYDNLLQWNIGDTQYYTIDLYQKILNISSQKNEGKNDKQSFARGISFYYDRYMEMNWTQCYAIVFFLLLIMATREKKSDICIAGIIPLIMILIFSLYLYFQGRYGLQRIELILWIAGWLLMLSLIKDDEFDKAPGVCIFIIVCMLLNLSCFQKYKINIDNKDSMKQAKQEVRKFYDYMNENKDKVYLLDATSGYMGEAINLFEEYPLGYCDNVLGLGGWYTKSPIMLANKKYHGIENIFADTVDNQHIYIVDKQEIDVEVQYIKEHYNKDAYAEKVEQIGSYNIYSIKTTQ